MKTYQRKGRLVFEVQTVNSNTLTPKDLVGILGRLTPASKLNLSNSEVSKIVPIIVNNKKPQVGDKVKYNGEYYRLTRIVNEEKHAIIAPINSDVATVFDVDNATRESIRVPFNRIYHRVLVPNDKINPRVLDAIRYGKIKEGYLLVVVCEAQAPIKAGETVIKPAKDTIFLKDGYAIIKPFKNGKADNKRVHREKVSLS